MHLYLQTSWAEVDNLNVVTEFPCSLGLTVTRTKNKWSEWGKLPGGKRGKVSGGGAKGADICTGGVAPFAT